MHQYVRSVFSNRNYKKVSYKKVLVVFDVSFPPRSHFALSVAVSFAEDCGLQCGLSSHATRPIIGRFCCIIPHIRRSQRKVVSITLSRWLARQRSQSEDMWSCITKRSETRTISSSSLRDTNPSHHSHTHTHTHTHTQNTHRPDSVAMLIITFRRSSLATVSSP